MKIQKNKMKIKKKLILQMYHQMSNQMIKMKILKL